MRYYHKKSILVSCAILSLLAAWAVPATAELAGRKGATDYVDMVDPYIMSARGRWFFFGTGKRPFGMVNLFPDTRNAGQGGGYNYRFKAKLNGEVLENC